MNQGRRQPPQGSPPSTGLGSRADEVRGQSSRQFPLALHILLLRRMRRGCWPRAGKKLPAGLEKNGFRANSRLLLLWWWRYQQVWDRDLLGSSWTAWTQTRRALRRSAGSSLGSCWLELCMGKENTGASKDLTKNLKWCQQKFHLLAKIHLGIQLDHQRLPQPGKTQCLPLAVHGGRGVPKGSPRPTWLRQWEHGVHPWGGTFDSGC
jgi:hypothetical protein